MQAKERDPSQRLHNIHVIEDKGKLSWQNQINCGRGSQGRKHHAPRQMAETKIAAQILNRMASLGMPNSQVAHLSFFSYTHHVSSKFSLCTTASRQHDVKMPPSLVEGIEDTNHQD